MNYLLLRLALTAGAAVVPLALPAASPVSVGRASFADAPPPYKAKSVDRPNSGFNASMMLTRQLFVEELPARAEGGLSVPGRPLPTNDWWTDLLNSRFSGSMWPYPAMLRTSEAGVKVCAPSYWADAGKEVKHRSSLTVGAVRYQASEAVATDWHDWDVRFRMPSAVAPGQQLWVTMAHGMPFTWFEFEGGMQPLLTPSESVRTVRQKSGGVLLEMEGDLYGVYFPAGATAEWRDGALRLPQGCRWMVVGLLRSEEDFERYAEYALSVPRATSVEWSYDEQTARLDTRWHVEAENLADASAPAPVLQGFLPHVWKHALAGADLQFVSGAACLTPRGDMKLAASASGDFGFSYRFSGMLPYYAAPTEDTASDSGFRRDIMDTLMKEYAEGGTFGADTYWGGKGLVQMALNMTFAKETGNEEQYLTSRRRLREALEEWLTYTPGEASRFFSYYPRWGAMLGFDVSYDSDAFNDHHFHYGYFTYAAALLCLEDADFARDYGELLTMIAKDYANWDRTDGRFPFLRTLDPWCGHSWAGGLGDAGNDNGNGQESSSEAMQGWGGVYLLGVALGDREMRDAGIFGWSTEARATREYWFDVDAPRPANAGGREAWPGKGDCHGTYDYSEYPYAYNSNITGKGIGWWTWFGGDPLFMHGIQWMPVSPALDYLSWDKDFVGWAYRDMMSGANSTFSHSWFDPTVNSDNGDAIEPLALNDWGNVALAYWQRYDPKGAAEVFARAWAENLHMARSVSTSHISYYVIHNHLTYGDPDFSIHADTPTAQAYNKDGVMTYTVYNPGEERTVRFMNEAGAVVKQFTAPAGRMTAYSADAAPAAVAVESAEGLIIPPSGRTALSARVLDQYGASMPSEKVTLSLSSGAPASISGNTLTVNANAKRGTTFEVRAVSGSLSEEMAFTVNDPPVPMSASVKGVPSLIESGSRLEAVLESTDQYGAVSTLDDARWSMIDEEGTVTEISTPYTPTVTGNFTFTATDGSVSASANCFVTPPLPLISKGARVVASSAENGGLKPANAVDGDSSTRWGSEHSDDQWIIIDLGADAYLSRVAIDWEAAYAALYDIEVAPDGCPTENRTLTIAGSTSTETIPTDAAWTMLATESATGAGLRTTTLDHTARYIRIHGRKRGSAYGYSMHEISLYGLDSSIGAADVIGVDFAAPASMDQNATVTLQPRVYTRSGAQKQTPINWSSDKEGIFLGNDFTPTEYGLYTLTATADGKSTAGTIFVDEVERVASIDIDASEYQVITGDPLVITPTPMNQFMAPYSGEVGRIPVTVTPAANASYDIASHTFRATAKGTYTISFGGMAEATVRVVDLNEMNLALGRPASASSANGGNRASNAVDGNADTRWESAWRDGEWMAVDLGNLYLIDRAEILWEGAYAEAYRLQVSIDGDTWYDVYSNTEGRGGLDNFSFGPVPAAHVRLYCDVRALQAYGSSVKELRIFGRERLTPPANAVAPTIGNLTWTVGNGSLTATGSAIHPSGHTLFSFELLDRSGARVTEGGVATTSGEQASVSFDGIRTGVYTLRLVASDPFGNTAERSVPNIAIDYSVVGINLALGADTSCSSSENDGLDSRYAVDGKLDTRWGSLFNDEEWMMVDLGMAYPLTEIVIHWNVPAYATDYTVEASLSGADSDFFTLAERSGFSASEDATDRIAIDPTEARYVRVTGHRRATGYGTSINEIEIYGNDPEHSSITSLSTVASDNANDRWYTLQGIALRGKPTLPGVYLHRQGARTRKVVVR